MRTEPSDLKVRDEKLVYCKVRVFLTLSRMYVMMNSALYRLGQRRHDDFH